jgi:hypothetical protein
LRDLCWLGMVCSNGKGCNLIMQGMRKGVWCGAHARKNALDTSPLVLSSHPDYRLIGKMETETAAGTRITLGGTLRSSMVSFESMVQSHHWPYNYCLTVATCSSTLVRSHA